MHASPPSKRAAQVAELTATFATALEARLAAELNRAIDQWQQPGRIATAVIDDVLPAPQAEALARALPTPDRLSLRHTLAEHKRVSAQLDQFDPALEAIVFAFQQPGVVDLLQRLTDQTLAPDAELYAGGISAMLPGHFLRPHLDNSHDRLRQRYRVLNALYYLAPAGDVSGGALELYDHGPRAAPRTVPSLHNRLVLMATHRQSLHGVAPVAAGQRWCVSNYYFTAAAPQAADYFHVTSFRGRIPAGGAAEVVADVLLRGSALLRMGLRRLFPRGLFGVWHRYRR